ncbi:hypothetical protein PDJAM_G00000510 [Pangasius djambal]|uniref:Uncharacterized protein n=1 Tax=Pangasius djambal TaxID=1691987 RepID=A0ACC5XXM9_9TELE|nr:hypothetical protein [Pangasius djambal]
MRTCDAELADGHGAVRRGCLFPALTGAPWRQCVGEISTPYTIATHTASHLLRTVILNTDLYYKHGGDSGAFSPCVAVDLGPIIQHANKNCAIECHAITSTLHQCWVGHVCSGL